MSSLVILSIHKPNNLLKNTGHQARFKKKIKIYRRFQKIDRDEIKQKRDEERQHKNM